jgi:hypothetical protein
MDGGRRTELLVVVAIGVAVMIAVVWAVAGTGGGSSPGGIPVLTGIVAAVALVLWYLQGRGRLRVPARLRLGRLRGPGRDPGRDRPSFERAGPSLIAAVKRAEAEALRLGHNYIGTEHLLLGLLGDPSSEAARLLAAEGVDLLAIRARVEAMVGRGTEPASGPIGLTPRSKRAIAMAFAKPPWKGDHPVEDHHLLATLLRVHDGLAAGLLTEAGVDVGKLRRKAEGRVS